MSRLVNIVRVVIELKFLVAHQISNRKKESLNFSDSDSLQIYCTKYKTKDVRNESVEAILNKEKYIPTGEGGRENKHGLILSLGGNKITGNNNARVCQRTRTVRC